MPLLVGLSGYSGVGKDTVARMLPLVAPGIGFGSVALAGRVKTTSHCLYGHLGLERPEYYDSNRAARYITLPLIGKSPVQVWCELGDAMRVVYANTWVDIALNAASTMAEAVACVTDVRYPNEAEAIQRAGGVVCRILNPRVKPLDTQADHAMDNWTGRYDYEIVNDGSETELENRVHRLWKHLEKRLLIDRKKNL